MGKDWDKALPAIEIWRECLRVLKDGAFAFVMSIPRADCLSRMIISLEDAGFKVNFTPIFWAYASGFPKAYNIAKGVEGKLKLGTADWSRWNELEGTKQTQKTGYAKLQYQQGYRPNDYTEKERIDKVNFTTPQAKALDGSYGGMQLKPSVEVVIVAQKPKTEKTYVDQALLWYEERQELIKQGIPESELSLHTKHGLGSTWLDDGRIPTGESLMGGGYQDRQGTVGTQHCERNVMPKEEFRQPQGRFPANLCCGSGIDVNLEALLEAKHKLY